MIRHILIIFVILAPLNALYSQDYTFCLNKTKSLDIFTNQEELDRWLLVCEKDTITLLRCLQEKLIDSTQLYRLPTSIVIMNNLSRESSNYAIKSTTIKLLLITIKSKNLNISRLSIKLLMTYPKKCINNDVVDSISSLLKNNPLVYKEVVELVGYLENPDFILKIKEVFPDSRNFSKDERWTTFKVLARIGDKQALDFCVNRVSSMQLNDQLVDMIFPDLIYVNRKETFDIIINALFSDENLCTSSNPNSENKTVCGYRIIELLAPVIVDFPVRVLPSGDLDSKDYRKSLKRVRTWFLKNNKSYSIVNMN
jgi:hypothetical protein